MRYGRKEMENGDFAPTRSVLPKISDRRDVPPRSIFAWIVRPMNALQLCPWQFSHKETLWQTFFKQSANLDGKRPLCVFEPLWGLRGNYDNHLRLIEKRVVDFLLVLNFFAIGVTAEALRANIGSKSAISLERGSVDPKFQVEGSPPPIILLLRKLGQMIFRTV